MATGPGIFFCLHLPNECSHIEVGATAVISVPFYVMIENE
jgi:hypothetical protein